MFTLGTALKLRTTDVTEARRVIDNARMLRLLDFPRYQVALAQGEAHLAVGLVRLSSKLAEIQSQRATLCPCKSADLCVCVPPF